MLVAGGILHNSMAHVSKVSECVHVCACVSLCVCVCVWEGARAFFKDPLEEGFVTFSNTHMHTQPPGVERTLAETQTPTSTRMYILYMEEGFFLC